MSCVNYKSIFMNHLKSNNFFFATYKDELEILKIIKLNTFYII